MNLINNLGLKLVTSINWGLNFPTRAMQPLGATKEVLAQMFQNPLTRAALRCFFNLDDARARSWEDICREFHK